MLPEKGEDIVVDENIDEGGGEDKTTDEFNEPAAWQAQTAGENKTNERLFKHRVIDDLANYALSLEDKLSKVPENGVFVPGENATEEEIKAYREAIGIPGDVNSYKKIDTGLDPSVDLGERELSKLAEIALEAEFKPGQYEAVQKWYAESAKERLAERNEQIKANTLKLTEMYKEKWGENFEANNSFKSKAVEYFGGEEFKNYLDKSGLGNFPKVIEFLVEKGKLLSDPKYLEGESGKEEEIRTGIISYPSMKGL